MALADDGVGVVPFPFFLHLRFIRTFLIGGASLATRSHDVIHIARHLAFAAAAGDAGFYIKNEQILGSYL